MDKRQLASRIWESANTMRSKIEAQEYKDYILSFIFYKFLSDQVEQLMYTNDVAPENLKDVLVEDDPETVEFVQNRLGYFISFENLYSTWRAAGNDFNVADVRDAVAAFDRLILPSRKHVFENIFRTLETGLSKLGDSATSQTAAIKKLLDLINDIPTDGKQGYDILGYIYEYLISKFAANAGKKAGEFYTPHEVSEVMSRIVAAHIRGRDTITIYDPTSGSGSLLLNIGQAVARYMGDPDAIKYYAQEIKDNTFNLTRMNLVMRGVKADNIVVRRGDSLEHDWPMFDESDRDGTYEPLFVDAVVSNPPYSQKWKPEGKSGDPRFAKYGLAPETKADYAFLLHELFHIKPDGVLTIVLPHGVLFRGGSEETIRKRLIEANNIDTIIGLPGSIFFGTGIPTIIMVLTKQHSHDDVLFIDASQDFLKDGKNNVLRARDIERIVDTVLARQDVENYARVVTRDEIRKNGYNLNIPRYVSATLPPEPVDFFSTVNGGIPVSEIDALAGYWGELPGLREALFDEDVNGYAIIAADDIRDAVLEHDSAKALGDKMNAALAGFSDSLEADLIHNAMKVSVSTAEDAIKSDLFTRLAPVPLISEYQGYQLLHEKWLTIANDLTVLQTEGWDAMRIVDPIMEWRTRNKKKEYVRTGWEGRVAPFGIVRDLYLPEQRDQVNDLTVERDSIEAEFTAIIEGLSEEDKTDLSDVLNAKEDGFLKTDLNKAVKALTKGQQWPEGSIEAIQVDAKRLLDRLTKVKSQQKKAVEELDVKTRETIENLTEDQVLEVLSTKWVAALMVQLALLPSLPLRELADQVQRLQNKYATPLTELDTQITTTERSLLASLDQLTGSDADMQAVVALKELLGGAQRD